jgi:hypothetical protein
MKQWKDFQFSSALACIFLLAAAAIRLAGINNQLWLDEIWSIRLAQLAGTPLRVFTLHFDNNHWLNTLVLMFLGPGRSFWQYHVFAEICGIGTVLLGWLLARRSIPALILLGASEFLVEYSTDARGYAPAGFFALAALLALRRHLSHPSRWTAVVMSVSAVLGLLSHLTFAILLAALAGTSVIGLLRNGRTWPYAIAHSLMWWAVPMVVLATLYFVDVRQMIRGGGPDTPSNLPSQAAAMFLGVPINSWAAPICGLAAVLLWMVQTWRLYQAGDMLWPVMVVAMAFVVGVLFFWPRSDYLHPRYVYVVVPLILIAIGMELDVWICKSRGGSLAVTFVLTCFCIANAIPLARFLKIGRGEYLQTLNVIIDGTAGSDMVVATSDRHPTSTLMVLQYYKEYHVAVPWKQLLTLADGPWGDQWPQWLFSERDLGPHAKTPGGVRYDRRGVFPNGGVASGIVWVLYESANHDYRVRPENLRSLGPSSSQIPITLQ